MADFDFVGLADLLYDKENAASNRISEDNAVDDDVKVVAQKMQY